MPSGSSASVRGKWPESSIISASTVMAILPDSIRSCTVGRTWTRLAVKPVRRVALSSPENRLVPPRVRGSLGRFPHALTNDSSLIGSISGRGSSRPVQSPGLPHAKGADEPFDADRLDPWDPADYLPGASGAIGDPAGVPRAASHGRQQSMARVAPGGRGGSMLRIHWPSWESSKKTSDRPGARTDRRIRPGSCANRTVEISRG